jgi:hypothetical protein
VVACETFCKCVLQERNECRNENALCMVRETIHKAGSIMPATAYRQLCRCPATHSCEMFERPVLDMTKWRVELGSCVLLETGSEEEEEEEEE